MNASRRDLTRLLALGAAAAVIGVPIGLMALTWMPLEPVPGNTRDDDGEEVTPDTERRRRRQESDNAPVTPEAQGQDETNQRDAKESSPRRATPRT